MTEFTDHDAAMLSVMANLERLRDGLFHHAVWFATSWTEASDEDVPFFEVYEEDKGDGMSSCKVVFVLNEEEFPTGLMEHFRQE